MSFLKQGAVTSAIIGFLWTLIVAVTVAVAMSFASGDAFKPSVVGCLFLGIVAGQLCLIIRHFWPAIIVLSLLVWR